MRTRGFCALAAAALLLAAGAPALAQDDSDDEDERQTIKKALTGGKPILDLRYRFEFVDSDRLELDAEASTLRLRLGYETGTWKRMFMGAAFEGLWVLGSEKYNSTSNGLTEYPVVADPEAQQIDRAYFGVRAPLDTTLTLGRQVINLDNQRFIGSVDFRQLEQTFDSFSAKSTFAEGLDFFYAYADQANRIFGRDNPNRILARTELKDHFLNVSYELKPGKLVGYAYLHDNLDIPMLSSQSIGVRFVGSKQLSGKVGLTYAGELTHQSPYADAPSTNNASYYFATLGAKIRKVTVQGAYEVLGGDGDYSFQTPLATLHKFQGWADLFLVTPLDGIRDAHIWVTGKVAGFTLFARYHDFRSDSGGMNYGTELDLLFGRTFHKIYNFELKYANYKADEFAFDVTRAWLTLRVKL